MIKFKKISIILFHMHKTKKNSFSCNRNGFLKIAILTQQSSVNL